jgi:four helix bundle protein
MELVEHVYYATRAWPSSERFGLVSQAQRACVSVPANISEGYGRLHRGEYLHHLAIANGSLCELETLLLLAERVRVAEKGATGNARELAKRVGQMLNRQIRSLRATQ